MSPINIHQAQTQKDKVIYMTGILQLLVSLYLLGMASLMFPRNKVFLGLRIS